MIRLIALVAATLALAGCGARHEQTTPGAARSLRVAMPPLDTGEGAVYAAQAGGRFKEAGLATVPGAEGYFQSFSILGDPKLVNTPELSFRGPDGATIPMSKVLSLGFTLTGTPGGPVGNRGSTPGLSTDALPGPGRISAPRRSDQ